METKYDCQKQESNKKVLYTKIIGHYAGSLQPTLQKTMRDPGGIKKASHQAFVTFYT